ncbi:MAG TPA: IS110 family transposase [Gemmatimonadales bacterium]|nr:IS110 family transposase [Gemmatimonadales bacterium]
MRTVALDLGNRISFCEVAQGSVIKRTTVDALEGLLPLLGPRTPKARVAIEACREAWVIHAKLKEWGHEPVLVDTTRARKLGIGQHRRKNDRIDAETLARALEQGLIPPAHVLSSHRQQLRLQLSVRQVLVETRAKYVTVIRALARSRGKRLKKCAVEDFRARVEEAVLGEEVRHLIAPLVALLPSVEQSIAQAERKLEALCAREPAVALLQTAPGVGPVVAAAVVAVVDDPKRFRNAHQVESYVGLVPAENTSGKRRLGSITKQGNGYLRALLVQAAWTVLRNRQADPLKEWGQGILSRRGKGNAAVAVARRLLGVLWAMWKRNTVYDPEIVGRDSAAGIERQAQSARKRAQAIEKAGRKAARHQRWIEKVLRERNAVTM